MKVLKAIGRGLWAGLKAFGRIVGWIFQSIGTTTGRSRIESGDKRLDFDEASRQERLQRWGP